jgi:hypothetical protein
LKLTAIEEALVTKETKGQALVQDKVDFCLPPEVAEGLKKRTRRGRLGGAEVTNDAGGTWRFVAFGRAGQQVGSAACPWATVCYALGSDLMAGTSWVFRTVDAGKSWERVW